MFCNIYHNKRVLVTGHTGFKGSWLCAWLKTLGADVCGLSLPLETIPAHSELLKTNLRNEICDIRDASNVKKILVNFQPDIVFHLAAQPIVRLSYDDPVGTFASNVMGTANVLEACRHASSIKAIVVISSDKCYENREQLWGYRETDPMGGYDPYSASKGCAELVVSSFRSSFFNPVDYGVKHNTLLASARAGNVIGGGDWAKDRLVPDLIRNAKENKVTEIRNPCSTRPWQHVLEPLSGYLALGAKLLQGETGFAEGWNFGPGDGGVVTVDAAAKMLAKHWDSIRFIVNPPQEQPHEAGLLSLDCTKARYRLNWQATLNTDEAFEWTAIWYKEYYEHNRLLTLKQLEDYVKIAIDRGLEWTN